MAQYVDSSALAKLYVQEVESDTAHRLLEADHEWISAAHTFVEVRRVLSIRTDGRALAAARSNFLQDFEFLAGLGTHPCRGVGRHDVCLRGLNRRDHAGANAGRPPSGRRHARDPRPALRDLRRPSGRRGPATRLRRHRGIGARGKGQRRITRPSGAHQIPPPASGTGPEPGPAPDLAVMLLGPFPSRL